ncbi:quinoprotein glucose dehydrogenase [Altererythrobacter atlanticus]|nr:pyrroloquinoline quinone-dependent dehydrogenase [Croceibacterium atlanticum]MBB5733991.1 quinoprotein glucose dehydrogenase [Croceibacterium atlanticum]
MMLLAACAPAQNQVASASAQPAAEFDFVGWDGYLGGSDSSQYSSLDQINTSNVGQLEVAWTFKTGEGQPPRFNPVVGGGLMYVITGDNNIAALNPANGQEVWRTNLEGRIGARGINYWQSEDGTERRLMVLNNGMLRAIDAHNGQLIQSFGENGQIDLRDALPEGSVMPGPLQTDNPGRIYKDTIIMSLPAGAYDFPSAPADIQAYDVRTGELKWVFHSVPREGEFGYDTWPAEDHEKFGGVHNWSEFTVDAENGIAFIPFGTARYDFYGGNREGDNLFANSIVALNAETGERIWHYQIVHHDLWDFDLPVAPKLTTINKDGKDIPVVIQATKHGYVFVFNRLTGEPIWPIEEVPVPASDVPGEKASPTQPIPTWPEPFTRQSFTEDDINPYLPEADQEKLREGLKTWRNEGLFTPPSLEGSISFPGHNGGTNWGGTAIDPVNNRFFVVSRELPLLIKLILDKREEAQAAMPNGGGDVKPYKSPVNFLLQSNGMVAVKPPFSFLTAYDMDTGEMLYRIPNGEIMTLQEKGITGVGSQAPRGGPVATAGGLLFVGTATDRTFRARDAATGEVLWEYELPAATEGVPAVYEVDGRQYVTIPVGGVGHFAGGLGLPEPGESQYMTFALPRQKQ